MLDSRDNSVLKSLKELRKQEEERVKKERAEAEARAEADRRAKEEVERKAKEEAERARRDEEARVRRIAEEKEAREREESLRLQEAERRARIEAEAKLAQEKMRLEAQVKTAAHAAKKAPIGLIVGIVAVVLVIAGGVIFKIKSDHEKQLAVREAEKQQALEREKLRTIEQERRMELMEVDFKKKLAEAKSDAERAAIQKQLDDARAIRHASSSSRPSASKDKDKKESAPAVPTDLIKKKKDVSLDPLDGLKL
jgi:colicin import membrane protein